MIAGWRTFLYRQLQPLPGETRENGQYMMELEDRWWLSPSLHLARVGALVIGETPGRWLQFPPHLSDHFIHAQGTPG